VRAIRFFGAWHAHVKKPCARRAKPKILTDSKCDVCMTTTAATLAIEPFASDTRHTSAAIAPVILPAYNSRLDIVFARSMTRTSRNRFVAWLGIAAMWLAIVAPVVSQSIAARAGAADPQAPICSAEFASTLASAALAAEAGAHHHGEHAQSQSAESPQESHHASAADHFDACSYCGLLAHHLPLLAGATPGAERVERVTRVAVAADVEAVYAKSFNAARPRAPPVVS
jgi:hypothetical protein